MTHFVQACYTGTTFFRQVTGLLVCALLILAPIHAQPPKDAPPFPTLTALENTPITPRDRVALARQLQGVQTVVPPPQNPPAYTLGSRESFSVSDDQGIRKIEAELRAISDSAYLWFEVDSGVTRETAQTLADDLETRVYPPVRALWGSENSPGIDGDPRIHHLFATGLGLGLVGYFDSTHTYPDEVVPSSNEREMMFYNLDILGNFVVGPHVESLIAHEFQHMIRDYINPTAPAWLNEGFSVFTELYLGYNAQFSALDYLNNPQVQLNNWPENEPTGPHYGGGMLFVTYFYERYGADALRQLSLNPHPGLGGFAETLTALDEPDINHLFADWVVANWVRDPSVVNCGAVLCGYKLLENLSAPRLTERVEGYPFRYNDIARQYSASYFRLENLPESGDIIVSLAVDDTVRLIPTQAASGDWMWYSNRADQSSMTLTRAFDLRETTSATLEYDVWYHIEDRWDYGYLLVSTDGGATWTPLETPHTTTDNPYDRAYGPGYTGRSRDWIRESISLDAYIGQEILLRFAMITDDAVNQPGMALDNLRLKTAGYETDVELDGGGWQADGWLRIDNRLPQQAWVQVVQQVGDAVIVDRWLAHDDPARRVAIQPGTGAAILIVSPFAPVTTVPAVIDLAVTIGQ